MSEEAVVFIDDEEIKVSELSDQQKYLHSQLLDFEKQRSQS